jgi:heavy metal sensor kinase
MSYRFLKSIRARIALWHLCTLAATLLLYMMINLAFLWQEELSELKESLVDDLQLVENYFALTDDKQLVWRGDEGDLVQGGDQRWIELRNLHQGLIYSNFPDERIHAAFPSPTRISRGHLFRSFHLNYGEALLVVQSIHQIHGQWVEIIVGRSRDRMSNVLGQLLMIQALGFPIVIVFAWIGSFFFAGRILSPLKTIIDQTKTISADMLHKRLPVENPDDELGQLSMTFNDLLGKLDRSFKQMRQFTADASHELRTPLAAIRAVGEMALRSPKNVAACQETIGSMLEEVDKLNRLLNDLLSLARSDSGMVEPVFELMDLGAVVQDEAALLKVLAEEKNQHLLMEIEQPCLLKLDRSIFRQAVSNLLHNAIKYTPEGKEIHITVGKTDEGCVLEITDSGPGIDPEHAALVFDRFYRVDKVRSRNTGGFGLGLAIAKWAVEIHGGRIEPHSKPGSGCTFRVCLPRAKQPIRIPNA